MKNILDSIIDRVADALSGRAREPEPAWLVLVADRRPATPKPSRPQAGCGRSWV